MDSKSASGTRGISRGQSNRSSALPVSVHNDSGALLAGAADLSSPQTMPVAPVSLQAVRFELRSFALLLVVVLVVVLGLISAGCGPPS